MKRREFILTTAGFTVLGLRSNSIANKISVEESKFPDAYDDRKVVRVYDPRITDYNFDGISAYWKTIDLNILRQMLSRSLKEISEEKDEVKALKKVLSGSIVADLSKKKVAIKVNFNNTFRDIRTTLNTSPAMMSAMARSLLDAGLHQENICFFDCSRPFPIEFKKEVWANNLEQVIMLGIGDYLPESDQDIFLSDNKGLRIDNKPLDLYPIPQCIINADYLINMHLVKIHSTGVTGAMKNLFGLSKNVALYMHQSTVKDFPESNHLPDISLNKEIKRRAKLNIAEFIFGGHSPDTIDKFTNEAFYPKGLPASLIVSRSPFYHDTVLYSFIKEEYETCTPGLERFKVMGPDTWLKKSSEQYPAWKYDQGVSIQSNEEGRPNKDLLFSHVNYVSI